MDNQEFLKQMVEFGNKLLQEKPKINLDLQNSLQLSYNFLDKSVNYVADVQRILHNLDDKRASKVTKAINHIMKAQEIMNELAEDEDVELV